MNDDFRCMKFIYLHCGEKMKLVKPSWLVSSVGRTYLLWSFPARERNALNRNSPVFDELWFFVKDISNSPGGSEPAHLKFV